MCTKDSMISMIEQSEQNAECCTAINNSTINNNIQRNKRKMKEKTHNARKKRNIIQFLYLFMIIWKALLGMSTSLKKKNR